MLVLTFYQFWPVLSVSINDLSLEMLHKHLTSLVRKMFGNTDTVRKNNQMKWSFLSKFSEIGLIFLLVKQFFKLHNYNFISATDFLNYFIMVSEAHCARNKYYINTYLTNGVSHRNHLDESTFIFRGVGSDLYFLFNFSMKFL